jgi:hypothetical protein
MKTFKDQGDREWVLQVNYSAKQRVQALAGVDLFDLSIFEKLGSDPGKLIEILYAICQEQADKLGLKKEQFYDAIIGDCLEAAADALTQEIINFFPKRRREVFQKLVATAGKVQDKALELIETKLDSGEILRKLEQSLNAASGSAPASSESTPAHSPSDSST